MEQRTIQILFALLHSAICETKLTEEERNHYSPDMLSGLLKISSKHDVAHLLAFGLKTNGLLNETDKKLENEILAAVYRCETQKLVLKELCTALEKAKIPFIPLKGAVLRGYYPEPWMRTSCDIDVLVQYEYLDAATEVFIKDCGYVEGERATHDVAFSSPRGVSVELHFDLVEEGRAKNAIDVLHSVWDNAALHENSEYWYEMTDAYFYFYHIAHMAKHFENGGCGLRPFVDLWILDHMLDADISARDELLSKGGLMKFAEASRALSKVLFEGKAPDELTIKMQNFLLCGGAYGSTDNRVALQQRKKGGTLGYLMSRIFIPYTKLKRYYPILEKHCWLMPVMQIRRWFMLLNPEVRSMAMSEIAVNGKIKSSHADEMNAFLKDIGID